MCECVCECACVRTSGRGWVVKEVVYIRERYIDGRRYDFWGRIVGWSGMWEESCSKNIYEYFDYILNTHIHTVYNTC